MTTLTPAGPHAHLYAELGINVEQLEEPPDYDDATSQHLDLDICWCWCPVCEARVAEIWTYYREPITWGDYRLWMHGAWTAVGQQLRPCGHLVSTVLITGRPFDLQRTQLTGLPVYLTAPLVPVTDPPGTLLDGPPPLPVHRAPFGLPPDGWVWGDRCHAPFEPSITGWSSDAVRACHCDGDPRRPRWPNPRPFDQRHVKYPNPSGDSNGAGGRGRVCPLCGSSVTHYGWEKRRLRPHRWPPQRRRWVHVVCPD